MSAKKQDTGMAPLFGKQNYLLMLAGVVVMVIGFFLMKGGKSDPGKFDAEQVYSTTRVTIAPIIILIGLAIEVIAIFRKPKQAE
ncbi:MAG: DUF3098 domain-containing protein [Chitinophagaceae bacterium]|nr:DUF3098 domain-containing protein [Chitinophagaceae bacterium]